MLIFDLIKLCDIFKLKKGKDSKRIVKLRSFLSSFFNRFGQFQTYRFGLMFIKNNLYNNYSPQM